MRAVGMSATTMVGGPVVVAITGVGAAFCTAVKTLQSLCVHLGGEYRCLREIVISIVEP